MSQVTGDGAPGVTPPPAAKRRGSLVLTDVFLVTSDGDAPTAVPRLSLVLDKAGLSVVKPDGGLGARLSWPDVSDVNASGRMRTPSGQPGVVVEAVTPSKTHRFVVPTDDSEGLQRKVSRIARSAIKKAQRSTQTASPGTSLLRRWRRSH